MSYQVLVLIRGDGHSNGSIWRTVKPSGELTPTPNYTRHPVTGLPVSGSGGWGCEFQSYEAAEKAAEALAKQTAIVPIEL